MKSKKQLTKFKNSSSKSDNSIRLNKFLANAGLGSRREADNLIKMGKNARKCVSKLEGTSNKIYKFIEGIKVNEI